MHPYRVLSIDGGGIRGLYSATVLEGLKRRFSVRRNVASLDVGKGFDLIVGASTGGILACALAYGCSPARLMRLYRDAGPKIFCGERMPDEPRSLKFVAWAWKHRSRPIHGADGLRQAIVEIFGAETLGSIYARRGIALCIPSVRLLNETPRVFKTGHLGSDFRRDDDLRVVDVCLATSAAPVFLPLAGLRETPSGSEELFADGGLWTNNPTPLGLIEALASTTPDREIVVVSVGTCPVPPGGNPASISRERGLIAWKAGSKALELSMNAQSRASQHFADRLVKELGRLGRRISVVRCHESPPPPDQACSLALDNASSEALGLLSSMGENDAAETYRWVQDPDDDRGRALCTVFETMPEKRADE
ncbi:MAG: patatin-like phospholipase family protein [Verrucomicrobiae bacterium]|nr:patatin-like phospholipase family protein [Verrucomicrobiae bacterium]